MLIIHNRTALTLRSLAAFATKRAYCKDYASSSDDEKDTKKSQRKERKAAKAADKKDAAPPTEAPVESAATRLNKLLASMQTDDNTLSAMQQQQQQSMARPGEGSKKRREAVKEQIAAKDVLAAAKRVASLLGAENQKQTESELLSKLLGHDQAEAVNESAAKEDQKTPAGDLSLSELIVGMKIDRSQQTAQQTRGDYVRRTLAAKRTQQQKQQRQPQDRQSRGVGSKREAETYTGSVNLFGGEPLGVFKDVSNLRDSPDMLSTWSHLNRHDLQLQVTHPPANYFEKIAQWTEQGKVWRFPIDNEQDLTEEVHVDFSEHIFLEQHLEPWCPTKGPIRHFMELVCVGLSKNPYITAREKKEHILWYRDYFETKKDILRDLMSKEKMEQAAKDAKQIQEP